MAFLQTVDEADVLGYVPLPGTATDAEALAWAQDQFGPLAAPEPQHPGRRLLYAAGLIEDEAVAVELAYALGVVTGLASEAVTAWQEGVGMVVGAANSAWKLVGSTFGQTAGTLLAMDQSKAINDDMAKLFALVTDDVSVERAFLSGQALGGLLDAPDAGSLDRRTRRLWPLAKSLWRTLKKAGKESWKDLQEIVRLLRDPSSNPSNLRAVINRWMRNTRPAFE